MTSNLGHPGHPEGPGDRVRGAADEKITYEKMKDRVMEELKRSFRPEFLNRIDEVIVFHSLTQEDVKQIVDLMMKRVSEQLKAKDLEIELTDAAKTVLAEKGYDPSLGARPLRRTIQRLVEDPLSEKLLWKEFRAGQTIIVDAQRRRDRVRGRRGAPARRAAGRARWLHRVATWPGRDPGSTRRLRAAPRPKPGPARGPGFSASSRRRSARTQRGRSAGDRATLSSG